jgi:hypothetical protein
LFFDRQLCAIPQINSSPPHAPTKLHIAAALFRHIICGIIVIIVIFCSDSEDLPRLRATSSHEVLACNRWLSESGPPHHHQQQQSSTAPAAVLNQSSMHAPSQDLPRGPVCADLGAQPLQKASNRDRGEQSPRSAVLPRNCRVHNGARSSVAPQPKWLSGAHTYPITRALASLPSYRGLTFELLTRTHL